MKKLIHNTLTTIDTLTDSQIRDLQRCAGEAVDTKQVEICRVACGDEETATQTEIKAARRACLDVIRDAEGRAEKRAAHNAAEVSS